MPLKTRRKLSKTLKIIGGKIFAPNSIKLFSFKFTPKSASFVEIWTEFMPIFGVNYAEKSFVKSVRK